MRQVPLTRQAILSRQVRRVDGRRTGARPLGAPFALAALVVAGVSTGAGCGAEPTEAPPERPAPARAPSCELGAERVHPGSSLSLAPGAIVLEDAGALGLLPLGSDPAEAIPLDALRVPPGGLARRGAGWLALAATLDGPALLVIEAQRGESTPSVRRVALGAGTLADGALAVRGDRAVAAWLDEAGVARVARIDLLRDLATAPVELTGANGGAPLTERSGVTVGRHLPSSAGVGMPSRSGATHVIAAATQGGAIVGFAAPGAPLFDVRDATAARRVAPGLVRGLAPAARGAAVLYEAPDRTGLWVAIDAPAVLATQPEVRAASPSLAAVDDGMLLVYREGRDVFLQPLDARGEPSARPLVAGAAGERASAPRIAVDEGRFWIAWETAAEDGPQIRVRAGRCD